MTGWFSLQLFGSFQQVFEGALNLYESTQAPQFGLGAHSQVKGQGDVDGDHGDHVDDVQRVMEELLPVGCEQQPHHHLKEKTFISIFLHSAQQLLFHISHLKGEPAGAENLQNPHGRVLHQLPFVIKSLNNKMFGFFLT